MLQVRIDLHTFGFRPDMTRRSRDSIYNDREELRQPAESVAIDASHLVKEPVYCGPVAEYVFEGFHFFSVAYSANEAIAEHLVAGLCIHRDNYDKLIFATLQAIYHAPSGWGGSEAVDAAKMVSKNS